MNILVTGGSGMVGSELQSILPEALYPTSTELDLLCQNSVNNFLSKNKITHVVHLAAYVGSLHDNIKNRIDYFDKNILMNTIVTQAAYAHGVQNFLGILSTCIFPDQVDHFPITENKLHEGKPHESLMSYAYAKRAHAVQLDNYKISKGVNYNYLIPCNLYGKPNIQHLDRQHFVNDLVMKIYHAEKHNNVLTLFGDGTPLRQFMHARDLAQVIKSYIHADLNVSMNVAPSENISIKCYVDIALQSLNLEHLRVVYDPSLPNGQLRKDVCNQRFYSCFPDFQFTPLNDGVRELYDSYRSLL
jgi:GDP-L-fucose synthase